jgi:ribosomal protein L6P/L9E
LYALPPGDTKGPEGPKKKNLKDDVVEVKQQNNKTTKQSSLLL